MICKSFSWTSKRGLKIYAQNWQPDGPVRGAVGLIHGLGEHIGRYNHVAETLSRAGFALVGFDQPGHGQSGGVRGDASFDDSSDEIDHLLKELEMLYPGVPRFLYGHSMGGLLVLYYALKRQPKLNGIVATSPALATGSAVAQSKILFARVMAKLAPSMAVDNGLDRNNLSRDPAVIKAYAADPLVHPRISARLGYDMLTLGSWVSARAAEFPLPLLLEHGSGDHIVSYPASEAFAKAAPPDKVTFKGWEGFYHETHNEPEKQEVLQVMVNWLEQHL